MMKHKIYVLIAGPEQVPLCFYTVTNNSHLLIDNEIGRWYVMYWVLAL